MAGESYAEQLAQLGWDLNSTPKDPAEVPAEEVFPIDEELEYLLISVADYPGFRHHLRRHISPRTADRE